MVSNHIISRKTVAANRITLLSNPTCLYSKEPQVFYGLCELMKQAKKEVIWHTPYIINNDYMYGEIAKIAKEVPEFTIMTNSVKITEIRLVPWIMHFTRTRC